MTLNQIFNFLRATDVPGLSVDAWEVACSALGCVEIIRVTEDSRRVVPGTLFVAVSGEKQDGHTFAAKAVSQGAVAILGSRNNPALLEGVPYLYVPEPRRVSALLAHELAGNPSRALNVIGITGTNGKSSIVCLTRSILREAGHRVAAFGTLGYDIGTEVLPASHTTPFGEELAEVFSRARAAGATHVVMEASSHALAQERVAGIDFDVAAFTNLTQDHLDFHETMEDYLTAKLRLFERLPDLPGKFSVVNRDDPHAKTFEQARPGTCITYGRTGDCRANDVVLSFQDSRFTLRSTWGTAQVRLNLLGRHNVQNALCAAAICGGMGVAVETIAAGLEALPAVPGRFEAVQAAQDFLVIVDYAHTEDGLKNVLEAARAICKGRIITVFGCGGDRDKTKRPKMAAVVANQADFAILTSDNPRTEDPHRILLDIEVGMQHSGKQKNEDYLVIENREEAIREGIARARAGDLVLIAGKGHEDYQILGTTKVHFDDREMARRILEGG